MIMMVDAKTNFGFLPQTLQRKLCQKTTNCELRRPCKEWTKVPAQQERPIKSNRKLQVIAAKLWVVLSFSQNWSESNGP